MQDYEINFWSTFSKLYNMTKEMYIKSEEYDDDFCSIIQPIKEQRDALDHIVRSYQALFDVESGNVPEKDIDSKNEYIKKNFDKAIGHIYRAFFDTADILTIILREHISNILNEYSYREIISCWKNYEIIRKKLVKMPKKIAELRLKKEIKSDNKEQEDIFKQYKEIIDFLFDTLDYVLLDFYPAVNKLDI